MPKDQPCLVCDGRGKGYFGESFEQICDNCNGTGNDPSQDSEYLNSIKSQLPAEVREMGNESLPYRCPVCSGNGLVPNGFYNQTSGIWSSSSSQPFEQCRSCNGTGIVWKPEGIVPDSIARVITDHCVNEDNIRNGVIDKCYNQNVCVLCRK